MHTSSVSDIGIRQKAIREKLLSSEEQVSYVRLAVISVNTVVFFIYKNEFFTHHNIAIATIILAWLYAPAIALFKPYKKYPLLTSSYFTSGSDAFLISLWIFVSGGVNSEFHLLIYISILAIAMRYAFSTILKVTAFYVLLYISVINFSGAFIPDYFYEIGIRISYMICIAVLGGYFSRQSLQAIEAKVSLEQSDEKIRKSETLLKDAQALGHVGSFEWDLITNKVEWSDELYRIYGYEPGEMELNASTYFSHIHPDYQKKVEQTVQKSLQEKSGFEHDYHVFNKQKEVRTLKSKAKVVCNEKGEPIKVIGCCFDITDLKKAEAEIIKAHSQLEKRVKERTRDLEIANNKKEELISNLDRANKELVKINEDIDNFVYSASHDLKTPIVNIEALLQILQEENDQETSADLMSKLLLCAQKMKDTIDNLSKVAKAQKEIYDDIAIYRFEEIFNEVLEENNEFIKNSTAVVKYSFEAVPCIHYSRVCLKSILYNFLSNAIKYRSPDRTPQIGISTKLQGEFIALEISDNGLGIDLDKNRHKLFSIFKRFHDHVEGTGIGLYMVNRIVEKNYGKIEVESAIDKGTTFRVLFKNEEIIQIS